MTVEPQNLEREHWSLANALAVWAFVLPRNDGEFLQAALRRHTVTALPALRSFASVERIEWVTASHGDDAAEIRPEGELDMRAVDSAFSQLPDVIEVSAWLDLRCVSSRGEEFVIRQGGTLSVLLVESHGRDVLERVQLELSLDVDLYSPRTYGSIRENSRLAAANGPRLSEFLRAVRDRMGGKIREIEAASYEGLVTDEGFIEAIESGS
jgi:hypothetical protein